MISLIFCQLKHKMRNFETYFAKRNEICDKIQGKRKQKMDLVRLVPASRWLAISWAIKHLWINARINRGRTSYGVLGEYPLLICVLHVPLSKDHTAVM